MPSTTASHSRSVEHTNPAAASTSKLLILVLSDPRAGSEEALGRVFNALATAYDFRTHEEHVEILFHGAGTRWIGELSKPDHPAHALFSAVKQSVAGASCGCADVFGGRDDAEQSSIDLITDNNVPGTSGLPSLRKYIGQGFTVLTF